MLKPTWQKAQRPLRDLPTYPAPAYSNLKAVQCNKRTDRTSTDKEQGDACVRGMLRAEKPPASPHPPQTCWLSTWLQRGEMHRHPPQHPHPRGRPFNRGGGALFLISP